MRTSKEPYPKPWNLPTGGEVLDDRVRVEHRIKASMRRRHAAELEEGKRKNGLMRDELRLTRIFQEVLAEQGEPTGNVDRKIRTLAMHGPRLSPIQVSPY